jgi:D-beta-D-heptose 7-phosphate kinase/D-beta-D-heptose 1-phosphate adenosyltransferase
MKIAVLGDVIEDIFIYGQCERLNPEGPTPLVSHQKTVRKMGGAANVVENLKSLGCSIDFFHPNTPPSKKTRIYANDQIICRLDEDQYSPKIQIDYKKFHYDFVILSDYNKGALTDCKEIILNSEAKVFVDPKKCFSNYTGAYCIKPNRSEFEKFYGDVTPENLRKLAIENRHELVIVTLGSDGLIYYFEGQTRTLPASEHQVADVTGAGDCFIAAMLYSLSKENNIHKAIELANIAAGISVRYPGTYVLKSKDLIKTKVFTNGCFDILHRGHIDLLEKSKQIGDYLIVGLNSDASVKKLKGDSRPINNQEDRKKALESFKFVDEVVIFDEETPYELIKKIKPDVITKGGDYAAERVVGNDLAIVKIIPFVRGYSSTKVINEIIREN